MHSTVTRKQPAQVDTVPFGAFKRELLALVGFFDETLLTNEDYEFNARIRKSGGRIWLDPCHSFDLFCPAHLGDIGETICPLWFLEMAHAAPISRDAALAAGTSAFVCAESDSAGLPWRSFCPFSGSCWLWKLSIYLIALASAGVQAAIPPEKSPPCDWFAAGNRDHAHRLGCRLFMEYD